MNKLAFILLLFICCDLMAQEKKLIELDLETCVNKAIAENIDLKAANNNTLYYAYEYKKALSNVLPQLNANWNMNKIYGTVFDQVSFQRIQKATTTSFPSINASITLFDGFLGRANQQEANALQKAAVYDYQSKEQQLVLNVSGSYFQCLKYTKTLAVFKSRIKALETLKKATVIQVEKGDRQLMELYAVEAQLETEKAAFLETNNQYISELNNLLTLMRSSVADSVVLKEPSLNTIELNSENTDALLKNNTAILIKEMQYHSSIYTRKKVFANFLPSVSLSGTLASSYSSNGIFDYTLGTVSYPTYNKQLNMNFYQIVGLNVQIPIFSKMNNYYSVRQQTINTENKKLELEKEKLMVQNQYSTYIENQKTIVQKQVALEKAAASANEAFRAGEIQYNKGEFTFYEMLNSLNKKNQAELDVWQNKVDAWMIRQKITTLEGNHK